MAEVVEDDVFERVPDLGVGEQAESAIAIRVFAVGDGARPTSRRVSPAETERTRPSTSSRNRFSVPYVLAPTDAGKLALTLGMAWLELSQCEAYAQVCLYCWRPVR